MKKIKCVLFFYIFFISYFLYSQQEKEFYISFIKDGKELSEVKYYIVNGSGSCLLNHFENKIFIKNEALISDSQIEIIAEFNSKRIKFDIDNEMSYIKIIKVSIFEKLKYKPFYFKVKYLFRKTYKIDLGFDYLQIVTQLR